jgi:hypothetical protein
MADEQIETGNEGQTTGGPGTQVQEVGNTGQSAGNQGQDILDNYSENQSPLGDVGDANAQQRHSDADQMGSSESRSGDATQHNP